MGAPTRDSPCTFRTRGPEDVVTHGARRSHVTEVGLDTASDEDIWAYADEPGFVIVSKDSDFRQLAFLHGPPPKAVWLRAGNVTTNDVHQHVPGAGFEPARS